MKYITVFRKNGEFFKYFIIVLMININNNRQIH